MRLGEYKDALALIRRYPWFGVGFAGSPDADLYVGVSNLYLLMGEIMGVLGVLAFLLVIAGYLVSLWRAWRLTLAPSTMRPSTEHPERSDRRERSRRVREDGFHRPGRRRCCWGWLRRWSARWPAGFSITTCSTWSIRT